MTPPTPPAQPVTGLEAENAALLPDDDYVEMDECPNCGGEGLVWGCFEDCCSCTDDDGLGCDPIRCDWCRPRHPPPGSARP